MTEQCRRMLVHAPSSVANLPSQSTQMPARFSACCSRSPWLLSCAPSLSAISRRTFSAYSLGSSASCGRHACTTFYGWRICHAQQ